MPFAPWAQQVQGARFGEEPPERKGWWEEPILTRESPEWMKRLLGGGAGPLYPREDFPSPLGILGSPEFGLAGLGLAGGLSGLGAGIAGLGRAMPPMAGGARAALATVGGGRLGTALKAIPAWMKRHPLLSALGLGVGGYAAYANRPGQGGAFPTTGEPELPFGPAPEVPPTGLPGAEDYPAYTGEPFGTPQIIEVGGQRFWWNPMGQGGIGGWELLPGGAAGEDAYRLTAEQQVTQYQAQREAEMEQIRLQYELERGMQGAGAAQTMAQMYAADPYKYWAQLGMGTPEAMARLTGGEIAPGEEFRHVPLSQPSAQWWQNLLPSEQQQIMGGVNWMGVDPQDWYSMYQRMIPGLGSRQMEPVWAR